MTKFSVTYKRNDVKSQVHHAAYVWAESYMEAWERAKKLEKSIPMIESIVINGVYLYDIQVTITIPSSIHDENISIVPWFVYFQLDDFIESEGKHPDYDKMIKYFEVFEAYEICADLVKRKKDFCTQFGEV